jgi:hypothetical protein
MFPKSSLPDGFFISSAGVKQGFLILVHGENSG